MEIILIILIIVWVISAIKWLTLTILKKDADNACMMVVVFCILIQIANIIRICIK